MLPEKRTCLIIYVYTYIYTYILQEKSCKFSIYILSHAYFDISVPCCLTLTLRHCHCATALTGREGPPQARTAPKNTSVACPFSLPFSVLVFYSFFYYSRIFFSQQINPWKWKWLMRPEREWKSARMRLMIGISQHWSSDRWDGMAKVVSNK